MIRIASKIKIHFLTVVIFILCLALGHLKDFLFSYSVMIIHESAHLLAAVYIGLKADMIVFYPYGVNLKLKNKFIHNLADEIILYMSGPLANCIMALAAAVLYRFKPGNMLQLFYVGNTVLFIANMLPVYPLDGGVICKKVLSYFMGTKTAALIMTVISSIMAAGIFALGIYTAYMTKFNFSVVLLGGFIICSIFTQNEKYDVDFVKELMFYKNKSKNKIKHFIAKEDEALSEIIKRFDNNKYSIVYFENDGGQIIKTMSETEIVNSITGGC